MRGEQGAYRPVNETCGNERFVSWSPLSSYKSGSQYLSCRVEFFFVFHGQREKPLIVLSGVRHDYVHHDEGVSLLNEHGSRCLFSIGLHTKFNIICSFKRKLHNEYHLMMCNGQRLAGLSRYLSGVSPRSMNSSTHSLSLVDVDFPNAIASTRFPWFFK